MKTSTTLTLICMLVLTACAAPSGGSTDTVSVVTTTTIFADFVRQVGGDRVSVRSLVPPGGEVHTFDPRPSDVTAFAGADLVLMNGLGLDDWVIQLIGDAGSDAPIARLAEGLPDVTYLAGDEGEGAAFNPHLWMRVDYAELYVDRVVKELTAVDPEGADAYRAGGDAYRATLDQLDRYVHGTLDPIPLDQRRIVSLHDAFPYFANAYGLQVVGTVISVPGQDPSAGQVADLIDAIRASGVSAILSEAQFPGDLPEQIAAETGVQVISDLYSDSVGPAPQDTYAGLIRWDVERIASALRE